jgi:NAD(P)-dependent dehydrogenase (short-subunit alcohol dehydrogenase family)
MRLEGKRVLITGTAGGQGTVAQERFAREGARVIGCDIREGAAELSAKSLSDAGFDVHGSTVDLSDPDQAEAWIEESVDALGGIDVLYNNGAGAGFAPFEDMSLEMWRHVIHHELDIIFHTTHPAWKHLRRTGNASVINTASMSGLRGIAPLGQAAHSAAKGGIIALTRSLAAEGAEHGIRVNAISPGLVKTPGTDAFVVGELREFQLNMHMIRRVGLPEDVVNMAVFLASDEASWITGQNYSVDGGVTAGFR